MNTPLLKSKSRFNSSLLLIALIAVSLVLVTTVHLGKAQASGTSVSGPITKDTTWTQANSPYTLTDVITINNGVTLTIEPGVTVNMRGYNFYVNGELVAKGTSTNPIYFSGNAILFEANSTSWNDATGSGSIIQNAVLPSIVIFNSSPKIDSDNITNISGSECAIRVAGGSPIISNNNLDGIMIQYGSPIISGNKITSYRFYQSPTSYYYCSVYVLGGSPTILNNDITSITTQQQTLTGWVAVTYPGITLSPNPEPTYLVGIYDSTPGQPVSIVGNTIQGCSAGINGGIGDTATIEKNLIINNSYGLAISSCKEVTISDNTIADNMVGISLDHFPSAAISYNNIEGNSQNSIFLANTTNNINAGNNWWGTTDSSVINQTIYDHKDNNNLGTVTFTPILTSPNSAAPNSNASITAPSASPSSTSITPNSSTSPSQSPTATPHRPITLFGFDWLEVGIFILLAVIAVLLGFAVYYLRKRTIRQT